MSSIIEGYEYDIFISYRQKDNKADKWVTHFVEALRDEIEATFKEDISIYFDENPHDGLLETHQVDASLAKKLKCLVIIPIISQTYCDESCFAWEHEFMPFLKMANEDELGMNITLSNGNVVSRVLPVKIHDLDTEDQHTLEAALDGPLRSIDFIYIEPGVNRPLKPNDDRNLNLEKTDYQNQLNKVANALKDIGLSIINQSDSKAIVPTVNEERTPEMKSNKKGLVIGLGIIGLAMIIYWGYIQFFNSSPAKVEDVSIAVLAFDDQSPNGDQEWLGDGMADEILNVLARVDGMQLTGKTSSFSFKGKDVTIKEIGKALNVTVVLEGSVSKVGDKLRITAQLIDVETDKHIWSEKYDRKWGEIFTIMDEVAQSIAVSLRRELSVKELQDIKLDSQVDPEAYEAYLKAQFYWEKLDQKSLQKALDYFQLAIDIDPDWADPYAGLANSWNMFGLFFQILPKSETVPKVYKYINKALELDPNSAQAHYVKALNAVWAEFDWEQGEEEFLRSLELNPNDALCRMHYSHLLMILNRTDEAVIQANQALELDPLKPLVLGLYGVVMINEGKEQSAIEHFEKAISIDSTFGFAIQNLNNIYMREAYNNGDFARWIEFWNKKVKRGGRWIDDGRESVLRAFHKNGHTAAIQEMFKMNEKYGNECYMSGEIKAMRYIKLNNFDKAMDCLEEAYENRDMFITYIATGVVDTEILKDNPRFIALLENMNLTID